MHGVGRRVRGRIAQSHLPPVIGHADWESQNLRWSGGQLYMVHDWDSAVSQPEMQIAGWLTTVFTATRSLPTDATLDETEAFLDAYAVARGRPWSADERLVCWAAGLWVRAFNAKKAAVRGGREQVVERLKVEAAERLRQAGA
ncbi:MAG TPA: hypothetical protein VKE41_21990 [Roseiflexaceae bacterium]|nr:hypothetical protein [Roseiflexaceae bacterium]